MALTKTAEIELLNVINGYNNNDKSSTILPNPMYRRKTTTTFINDINTKLGVTDTKIVGLHHSKDIVVVVANYSNDTKGVLAYYNPQFDIYEILSTWYDNGVTNDFYPFKETKLNRQNFLYGLCEKDGKVHFFLTSDLMEAVGVLSDDDFKENSFYSAIFDIETEILKDDDGKDLEPKVGNALFGDYEKIGFNQDAFNNDLYSFVLWKDNGDPLKANEVQYVKFTAELSQQEAIVSDWQINEAVGTTTGTIGTGIDFKGISNIAVLSGEETLSSGETSLGSIMFSTQKDAGSVTSVPYRPKETSKTEPPFNAQILLWKGGTTTSTEILVSNDEFQKIFAPIKNIKNNPNNTINSYDEAEFNFLSKYNGGTNINWKISSADFETIINANEIHIETHSSVSLLVQWHWKNDLFIVIDGVKTLIKETNFQTKAGTDGGVADIYQYDSEANLIDVVTNCSFDFTSSVYIDYISNQIAAQQNTSSQIVIGKDDKGQTYRTAVSQINSYEGTAPVFEAPRKAFQPIKSKTTNQYAVYEFDGVIGTTQIDTFWNDVTNKDYTTTDNYKKVLTQPQSITSVTLSGGTPLPTTDYSLDVSKGELTIKVAIATGTPIVVDYQTLIGVPKQTNLTTTTQGSDIYIAGIEDNGELSNTGISIIGAGDNSTLGKSTEHSLEVELKPTNETQFQAPTGEIIINAETILGADKVISADKKIVIYYGNGNAPGGLGTVKITTAILNDPTKVFGFNLYRSTPKIDYDEIAEESEDIDFKVAHVKGYRQKNLLYIFAYNADYTEVVEWTQIYPDNFKPYTYLPYANPDEYFAIERFNQNKQEELRNSVFDREFLDIGVSGNTLLASTQAENTDLNDNDNDSTVIYGHTNEPVFTFAGQIVKGRNEIRALQLTVNSSMVDRLQGKEVINESQGELLTQLFGDKNKNAHNLIALGQAVLAFADGTTLERPATDFTTVNEVDRKIEFGMSIIDKNNKAPEALIISNVNGDAIITIDLTQSTCVNGKNINFDIVIAENADGIKYDYARLDLTGYDKPYEPITAKGGK